MKVMMIVDENISDTSLEMIRMLGFGNAVRYTYSNKQFDKDFENDQKYFDCIYCENPKILLNLKIKIPYFYDIPSGTFKDELNFKIFNKYYSQISGAKAVFVNDKKMSRYAHWADLNPYWVNEGILIEKDTYIPKKFITPNLNIGYICDNEYNFEIIKDVISAKKSNWIFHLAGHCNIKQDGHIKFYNGDSNMVREHLYKNCHILLNPKLPHKNSIEPVPSRNILEAILQGCIPVLGNIHDNLDHIFFDQYHYLKLDFIDSNTTLETIRYADKRREKLDRMVKAGRELIYKYFNAKITAKNAYN